MSKSKPRLMKTCQLTLISPLPKESSFDAAAKVLLNISYEPNKSASLFVWLVPFQGKLINRARCVQGPAEWYVTGQLRPRKGGRTGGSIAGGGARFEPLVTFGPGRKTSEMRRSDAEKKIITKPSVVALSLSLSHMP